MVGVSDAAASSNSYASWLAAWWACARFDGSADQAGAVEAICRLYTEEIGDSWHRSSDSQLLGARYRRGDVKAPHPGEHTIEAAILAEPLDGLRCFAGEVIDGINAVPLARDPGGKRAANVEADVALRVRTDKEEQLLLVEVKDKSNNAWYAAVENLLQLRLAQESGAIGRIFTERARNLDLPPFPQEPPPLVAVVLGPPAFYESAGQKRKSVAAARALFDAFAATLDRTAHLAVWNAQARAIDLLPPESSGDRVV